MNFKEVEKVAGEKFNGSARECRVGNGMALAVEFPGMGGKGRGFSFIDKSNSQGKF